MFRYDIDNSANIIDNSTNQLMILNVHASIAHAYNMQTNSIVSAYEMYNLEWDNTMYSKTKA